MYGKIEICGQIELVTGMHIGGSSAFAAIGAVDSPVIRDVRSGLPIIPGSSLKGKMRTLLAKEYDEHLAKLPDDDDPRITRLFGSAKKGQVQTSRILFPDMLLSNADELRKQGVTSLTEVKFENGINRATAVANPRQIERAIRGSLFDMSLIYEIVPDLENEDEIYDDISLLAEGMKLLEYDYLGGSGSRGYGKVKFNGVKAEAVIGDLDDIADRCTEILKESLE
ncbi:MAG: type III-A CRISPR-associated RAMP protein Csm3 [Candidatus Weimeria sp.]